MSVAVLIATDLDERFDWTRHTLRFLYETGHVGETLVGVWHGQERIDDLKAYCADLSPQIRIFAQSKGDNLSQRLLALVPLTAAPYLVFSGDDDFLHAGSVHEACAVLERDPSVCCAQGRFLRLFLDFPLGSKTFKTFPTWQSLEEDPLDRFVGFMGHLTSTLYAVYRRDQFIERFQIMHDVLEKTDVGHFWEFTGDAYSAIKGKIAISDKVYMVKGSHHRATSKVLVKQKSDKIPPTMVFTANFSLHYKVFEGKILDLLSSMGVDIVQKEKVIQEGMIRFMEYLLRSKVAALEPAEAVIEKAARARPTLPEFMNAIILLMLSTAPEDLKDNPLYAKFAVQRKEGVLSLAEINEPPRLM